MNRFPAEWEKQSAVLIAWPHQSGDFKGNLPQVEQSYCIIANTISRYQKLIIVCKNLEHQAVIAGMLKSDSNTIHYIHAEYNDIWVRDTVFLTIEKDDKAQLMNFQFNGWGNKYEHDLDNVLNHKLMRHLPFKNHPHKDIDLVLEGGSIESDGVGTFLTTTQCLLNPNRNPDLTRDNIEAKLKETLGAQRIFWISQDHLEGDDTDAHIDTLVRFCSADTIAYTSCSNTSEAHYQSLKDMEVQLQALKTVNGEPYRLIPLELPEAIYDDFGQRLPANYANFLFINNAVLVPAYSDPLDQAALTQLKTCFPDRDIVSVPCRPIVHQYGSLHCMTMQFPEAIA